MAKTNKTIRASEPCEETTGPRSDFATQQLREHLVIAAMATPLAKVDFDIIATLTRFIQTGHR